MKLGIAQRLALLLAVTGVLASGLTGYYAYSNSRALLVQAAQERMQTAVNVLARQLTVSVDSTARDVRMLAGHPRIGQALQASQAAALSTAKDEAAKLFVALLETRPEYFQVRLISVADHGMEQVRVDRDLASLLRVPAADLQEKGHYPYVFETLRLTPGEIYVSSPTINHEMGAHAGQGKPTLQLAAPVHDGKLLLGVVVINVDMNYIFSQIAADLPRDFGLYLTNRLGDFLVHVDSKQAFAFDQGRRVLAQDQFPATKALFDQQADQIITTTKTDGTAGETVVAAFVRQPLLAQQPDAFFVLGLSKPLRAALAESDTIGRNILRMVIAFSVLSLLVAAILGRAFAAPVMQIVEAVRQFARERIHAPMPVRRSDELGMLARAVDEMQHQILSQMGSLQEKQIELDHLASHDSLTGLVNRRIFLERFELMIARAKRNHGHLAMLFIDLDGFKEINDSLGHAIGDMVLRSVAERIYPLVREVDTVARLGGDEFVILLDGAHDHTAIDEVANKVLEAISQPIPWSGKSLRIAASVGIALYPDDGLGVTELIASADKAMYTAKANGRNRCVFSSRRDSQYEIDI